MSRAVRHGPAFEFVPHNLNVSPFSSRLLTQPSFLLIINMSSFEEHSRRVTVLEQILNQFKATAGHEQSHITLELERILPQVAQDRSAADDVLILQQTLKDRERDLAAREADYQTRLAVLQHQQAELDSRNERFGTLNRDLAKRLKTTEVREQAIIDKETAIKNKDAALIVR